MTVLIHRSIIWLTGALAAIHRRGGRPNREDVVKLYLVRHGRALSADQDLAQPLSVEGRDDIAHLARTLGNMNIRVHRILHSGKLRAEETARIIAQSIQPPGGVSVLPGLGPNDEVGPVLDMVGESEEDLMLVSHLPFLANLLQALLGHPDQDEIPVFHTGNLVAVEKIGSRWKVFRNLGPRMIL